MTETPECLLFLSEETELGFPPLPSPAVDLGTHFASLNLGLLICEVWGWVAPHSSVFPFEVFACAVTSSFAPTASPIRSLLTRAFRCWHNLRASLGWHMSGFPAWERGKTTDTQGRSRCSASGPLRGGSEKSSPSGWRGPRVGGPWPTTGKTGRFQPLSSQEPLCSAQPAYALAKHPLLRALTTVGTKCKAAARIDLCH